MREIFSKGIYLLRPSVSVRWKQVAEDHRGVTARLVLSSTASVMVPPNWTSDTRLSLPVAGIRGPLQTGRGPGHLKILKYKILKKRDFVPVIVLFPVVKRNSKRWKMCS